VLVPVDRNSEWLVREAPIDIPAGTSTFGPSITVSGARHYYMQHWGIPGTPWLSRLLPEGTEEVVARGDTDINSADLSPDGCRLVYTRDDPATEAYDIGVVLARPDGSEPRTIIQMPGKIAVDGWSRDGSSLLVMKMGSSDTIFVFSPTGKRLHELAAHPVSVATWCGPDHVLFRTDWRTEEPLRLWNPSTGQVRALDFHPLPAPSVCSPDGTAIAAWLAEGATTKLVVYDIRSSETLPVLDSSMPVSGLVWAARPGPVVDRVEIVGRRTVLAWGSSDSLGARVFDSEGRLRDDRVTWSSTDHHVASIDERGVLSANAPGVVSIVATAGVWRSDTLDVRVTSDSVANLLHSDPLASIDTTLWQIYGGPASPTIVQGEDGPVLSLPGDGVHRDGLISRHGLDMSHGATLEIAMRLKVDRTDRQQYSIYMFKPRSHIAGELDLISLDGYLAATWPADELHRFDSESLQVHVGNVPFKGGLPGSFDPDGWNRLALQVRVDGQVSAWVNGELVVLPPLHADLTDGRPWHIAIVGAAVDTDLHARDLIVWRGNRYTTPQN
jgi:hypothetical protein